MFPVRAASAHIIGRTPIQRLAPSPCTRLSRARSTMSQSDSPSTFSLPPFAVSAAYLHKFDLDSGLPLSPGFPSRGSLSVGLIVPQELRGPLKFSTDLIGRTPIQRLSCCMPGARTPAGPPASHPIDAFVWASVSLTTSPPALMLSTRLISLRGGADTPLAYSMLCLHTS